MKKALAGFVLGILLSTPGFAATSIDTAAFKITYTDGPVPEDWSITLIGETAGKYRFSLDTMNQYLALSEARDLTGAGSFANDTFWSVVQLDIDAAYRITAVRVRGTASGEMGAGYVPDFPPGTVHNNAGFNFTVWQPSPPTYSANFTDFQGGRPFVVGPPPVSLTETTQLGFSGFLSAQAWGVNGDGAYAESIASASLRDLVLEVEVSPVPEPGTWAMLLAGLSLVACLVQARRLS